MNSMKSKLQKALAAKMKREGATAVPNENTYIATAQEQAARGDTKAAMDTMQFAAGDYASKQIADQEAEKMKAMDPVTKKKYEEYLKAQKKK